jgi:hypothetical protein
MNTPSRAVAASAALTIQIGIGGFRVTAFF